jgi:uncharacterized protein
MMNKTLKNHLLIALAWVFIILAAIGVVLPVVPTTPFLIVALALFSKSSPRFHRMLLNNPWFGPSLQQWEATKTLARSIKYKASGLIIIAFTVSLSMLQIHIYLQLILVCIAILVLRFIWRIKEPANTPADKH